MGAVAATDKAGAEGGMGWHDWFGFVLASAVLGLVPGPGVISIVGYAVGSGRRTALASAAGMAVGNAIAITASLAGVGAVLAASAFAYAALKWAGALYLVGMGLRTLWTARSRAVAMVARRVEAVGPRAAFGSNVLVGTFHPKTIAFFVAFVPQFIGPDGSYLLQAALLAGTFCLTVLVTDTGYALAASGASRSLRRPHLALWSKRASGAVLVAAGVATAAGRR